MKSQLSVIGLLTLASCTNTATATTNNASATTGRVATTTARPSVAPPTSETTATADATTAPPTTTAATAPTTSVEDEILAAVIRADTVMKNCLQAGADCDRAELETALVGVQLEGFPELAASGNFENVDAMTSTVLDDPTLVGDELAVVDVCTFDPVVATYPDGRVDDEQAYYRQDWRLAPVGRTWKLAQIINKSDPTTDPSICDA